MRVFLIAAALCLLSIALSAPQSYASTQMTQLTKEAANGACPGKSGAYLSGCRFYLAGRLQYGKLASDGMGFCENKCKSFYGDASPNALAVCKEACAFVATKDQ